MFKLAIPVKNNWKIDKRRNAMSLENNTNQVHRTQKKKYDLQYAVEYCTFWQLTTKGKTPYNQPSEEEFHEAAGA